MATPSSSATSPSPPMAYLQPVVPLVPASQGPSSSSPSSSTDSGEGERRKKAVQKFLARAELSNVTRTLRSRLSHASSKTTHNFLPAPLGDPDVPNQSNSSAIQGTRSYTAKRKALSQPIGTVSSPFRRGSLGPSPKTPANIGSSTASTSASAADSNTQTLFSSILAPPPQSQARTIFNANDPPVAAPIRPPMSPKMRNLTNGKVGKSIAEPSRALAKSRRQPDKRKGKSKKVVDADGDVDMEAAATLTSLLLHHRPSIAGSASSPRSSIDGSEAGTPYSQQPASAHSSFSAILPSNPSSIATLSASHRSNTPPRSLNTAEQQHGQTTPRPAPTDNEAADLMLFLATSPSPARPTTSKDARDAAAFRAITSTNSNNSNNSSMMRAKPRVLFPTYGESPDGSSIAPSRSDTVVVNNDFNGSSMLKKGSDMESAHTTTERGNSTSQALAGAQLQHQQNPLQGSPSVHGAHLLPPPSLPVSQRSIASNYPSSPSSLRNESSPKPEQSVTGTQSDFNFSEYIHASPDTRTGPGAVSSQKANLGLRADVGRKLFEEEQLKMQQKRRPEDRGLEAGIDLVRT
ncbi:hypothetical protein EV361DRAFT_638054 [Lentinula raphanica]|uniref:Uncharacterized protein n=1 Tax=Lentinula raphanica TaxID=153919 RepID=A0AA38PKX8_9AGAR|nr:hypothetical protein F5878DRAFT_671877 [Lentinula raphanica]KAJ3974492.1 hypothetical protein EV361DRAFT_638054 [Lentinula raphanica]